MPPGVFTGIVEEKGSVETILRTPQRIELTIRSKICGQGTKVGDSIAVNGCCLTVVRKWKAKAGTALVFDLLRETWDRTNFRGLREGSAVNLERSLLVGDRLGGHFVTGHIDTTGKVKRWTRRGADWELEVAAPPKMLRFLTLKGSIALDGISLTLGPVRRGSFVVWIIPHTYQSTALGDRRPGSTVNIEVDILARYVQRFGGTPRSC